jgi:hypothetical protein
MIPKSASPDMKWKGIPCALGLAAVVLGGIYVYKTRRRREGSPECFALAENCIKKYGLRETVNRPEAFTISLILGTADVFLKALVENDGRLFLDVARRNDGSKHTYKLKGLVSTTARSMHRIFNRKMDQAIGEPGDGLEENMYRRMLLLFFRVHKVVRLSNAVPPEIIRAEMVVLRNNEKLRMVDDEIKIEIRQNKRVWRIGLAEYFYRYAYVHLSSIFRLVEFCENE